CTAWLPVIAPSARTASSVCSRSHSLVAPRRARVCSSATEPRSLMTSSAVYARLIWAQRGSVSHSCRRLAACWLIVSMVVPFGRRPLARLAVPLACPDYPPPLSGGVCKILYFFPNRHVLLFFAMEEMRKLVETKEVETVG